MIKRGVDMSVDAGTVCRAFLSSLEVKVFSQPDGGEGIAKRKGIVARRCLKEARSKHASQRI